jgi:predicted nuclease of predicted toxin-antitoxin system
MRLLLDQGPPRTTAGLLRSAGHDSVHVGDLGLSEATDSTILDLGLSEDRVIVTLDSEFHALLARSRDISPSVIRIREEGIKTDDFCKILRLLLALDGFDYSRGFVMSYSNGKVRTRSLPLA